MGKGKSSRSKADNSEQYIITARNLARKGKTNKKLKSNPLASKYESSENTKLKEHALNMTKLHPKGTGYKYRKNNTSKTQ